ncbi:MAG: ATP-binding cassette domain-containing protein [Sphingobacteriaceae bacterium]|nr:MAG: ATP-binding cassette domain-containing protein [Sphingobacteriaceae bacterium]
MSDLLEIDSVTKSFGYRVLTDIYLKCSTGDIIGLLGRNGTGKSTLLKIIFGTEGADNCFIRINGKVSSNPYITSYIAYLPQDSFLPKQLTIIQIIELYLGKEGMAWFTNDIIISPLLKSKVSVLSGGELKYFEVKLLLTLPAKFILLDEPFNGIAPIVVEHLKQMIQEYSKTKGIILTDHDYRNVLDVANSYYLLHDGALKFIKNKDDLIRWGYLSENNKL